MVRCVLYQLELCPHTLSKGCRIWPIPGSIPVKAVGILPFISVGSEYSLLGRRGRKNSSTDVGDFCTEQKKFTAGTGDDNIFH